MRRSFWLLGLLLALALGARAQSAAPMNVNVCDVAKNPAPFNGKMVSIKGTVVAGFDEFVIKDASDPNCGFQVNGIWLSYPRGTKAKSGPVALLTMQPAHNFTGKYTPPERTTVTLEKNKEFKQFDSLLAQTNDKVGGMCLGCARYEVTATLVGRLDTVASAIVTRDASGKIVGLGGFGNMNAYPARLVLQSVSNVTSKEVDYKKVEEITKNDMSQGSPYGYGNSVPASPLETAHTIATRVPAGQYHDQAERAIAVFPQSREQNGVSIVDGTTSEILPETPGDKDSPDGILFNCIVNQQRLQGDDMAVALFHLGQHVADLRSPKHGNESAPLIVQENDAWVVTSLAAAYDGKKYLTLPGGYLFWNSSWPAADRNFNMESALKDFLANEALLSE